MTAALVNPEAALTRLSAIVEAEGGDFGDLETIFSVGVGHERADKEIARILIALAARRRNKFVVTVNHDIPIAQRFTLAGIGSHATQAVVSVLKPITKSGTEEKILVPSWLTSLDHLHALLPPEGERRNHKAVLPDMPGAGELAAFLTKYRYLARNQWLAAIVAEDQSEDWSLIYFVWSLEDGWQPRILSLAPTSQDDLLSIDFSKFRFLQYAKD